MFLKGLKLRTSMSHTLVGRQKTRQDKTRNEYMFNVCEYTFNTNVALQTVFHVLHSET